MQVLPLLPLNFSYRIRQFYETYPCDEFVSELMTQLEARFTGNKTDKKVSAPPTQIKVTKSKPNSKQRNNSDSYSAHPPL